MFELTQHQQQQLRKHYDHIQHEDPCRQKQNRKPSSKEQLSDHQLQRWRDHGDWTWAARFILNHKKQYVEMRRSTSNHVKCHFYKLFHESHKEAGRKRTSRALRDLVSDRTKLTRYVHNLIRLRDGAANLDGVPQDILIGLDELAKIMPKPSARSRRGGGTRTRAPSPGKIQLVSVTTASSAWQNLAPTTAIRGPPVPTPLQSVRPLQLVTYDPSSRLTSVPRPTQLFSSYQVPGNSPAYVTSGRFPSTALHAPIPTYPVHGTPLGSASHQLSAVSLGQARNHPPGPRYVTSPLAQTPLGQPALLKPVPMLVTTLPPLPGQIRPPTHNAHQKGQQMYPVPRAMLYDGAHCGYIPPGTMLSGPVPKPSPSPQTHVDSHEQLQAMIAQRLALKTPVGSPESPTPPEVLHHVAESDSGIIKKVEAMEDKHHPYPFPVNGFVPLSIPLTAKEEPSDVETAVPHRHDDATLMNHEGTMDPMSMTASRMEPSRMEHSVTATPVPEVRTAAARPITTPKPETPMRLPTPTLPPPKRSTPSSKMHVVEWPLVDWLKSHGLASYHMPLVREGILRLADLLHVTEAELSETTERIQMGIENKQKFLLLVRELQASHCSDPFHLKAHSHQEAHVAHQEEHMLARERKRSHYLMQQNYDLASKLFDVTRQYQSETPTWHAWFQRYGLIHMALKLQQHNVDERTVWKINEEHLMQLGFPLNDRLRWRQMMDRRRAVLEVAKYKPKGHGKATMTPEILQRIVNAANAQLENWSKRRKGSRLHEYIKVPAVREGCVELLVEHMDDMPPEVRMEYQEWLQEMNEIISIITEEEHGLDRVYLPSVQETEQLNFALPTYVQPTPPGVVQPPNQQEQPTDENTALPYPDWQSSYPYDPTAFASDATQDHTQDHLTPLHSESVRNAPNTTPRPCCREGCSHSRCEYSRNQPPTDSRNARELKSVTASISRTVTTGAERGTAALVPDHYHDGREAARKTRSSENYIVDPICPTPDHSRSRSRRRSASTVSATAGAITDPQTDPEAQEIELTSGMTERGEPDYEQPGTEGVPWLKRNREFKIETWKILLVLFVSTVLPITAIAVATVRFGAQINILNIEKAEAVKERDMYKAQLVAGDMCGEIDQPLSYFGDPILGGLKAHHLVVNKKDVLGITDAIPDFGLSGSVVELDSCAKICLRFPNCKSFDYHADSSKCYLNDDVLHGSLCDDCSNNNLASSSYYERRITDKTSTSRRAYDWVEEVGAQMCIDTKPGTATAREACNVRITETLNDGRIINTEIMVGSRAEHRAQYDTTINDTGNRDAPPKGDLFNEI